MDYAYQIISPAPDQHETWWKCTSCVQKAPKKWTALRFLLKRGGVKFKLWDKVEDETDGCYATSI